jgi:hypothetical protein
MTLAEYLRSKPGTKSGKKPSKSPAGRKIVATYDYNDTDGKLVFQVVRYDPKDFLQRRPDGHNGWIWNLKGIFRVPYRLPEILAHPDSPIFIVEGEKDAMRVSSLDLNPCATTIAGQKWTADIAAAFKGRDVYILADNDEAGREAALNAAQALRGHAASIRIVDLPDLPDKGDVSDWLDADPVRNSADLVSECLKTPLWDDTILDGGKPAPAADVSSEVDGIVLDDFIAYLPTHQYYHCPTGAMWAAVSINAKIKPIIDENGDKISASTWLDKHHCAVQTTWMPGEPLEIKGRVINDGGWMDHAGVTCLNLYKPPNVAPGNGKLAGPWIRHLIKVYGKADAKRLLNWFAHRVQRPHEKINHALFLGGSPGIGKDTLLAPVINAIGPWNAQDIAPKTLLGQFNTYARAVILRVSETHDLGDVNRYTFYDASKVYCASPPDFLRVNQKHMQEFYVKNVCGVIYTSNYRDGLYLPPDDRRHDVMWSELVAADFPDGYWTKLWSWYSTGGYEHVAAYLMARDISKFDPAAPPPKGPAFWAMVDASAAPEDGEFADLLDCITHDLVDMGDGRWPDAVTLSQVRRYADDAMKTWIDDRRNRRSIPHRFEKCGYVPVRNETRKEGNWIVLNKRQVIYAKSELSIKARYEAALALSAG